MKYRTELTGTAKADIRETMLWLRDNRSPGAADRWLAGLSRAIQTLERLPGRCPLIRESNRFPQEVRELLYGRKKASKYRIIYTIIESTVYVLYVRHHARDDLQP